MIDGSNPGGRDGCPYVSSTQRRLHSSCSSLSRSRSRRSRSIRARSSRSRFSAASQNCEHEPDSEKGRRETEMDRPSRLLQGQGKLVHEECALDQTQKPEASSR
jgi:hypothetical protein